MPRFQLDPNKTAMENVYAAARIATVVIGRRHRWWGMVGESRDELFDRIRDATVENFIRNKVIGKKYCRVAKDGRKLNFADNVISSCYSVAGYVADVFIQEFLIRYNSDDIDPLQYAMTEKDRFPLYVSDYEKHRYKKKEINELGRPMDRARKVKEYYEDYCLEVKELGLSETLPFDKWLSRNGYNQDDDLMWALLPDDDKRELVAAKVRAAQNLKDRELLESGATDKALRQKVLKRAYMREWFRKRREELRQKDNEELSKLYGPAPKGYIWYRYRTGRIGQRRIK